MEKRNIVIDFENQHFVLLADDSPLLIDNLIQSLIDAKNEGATHIKFDVEKDWDGIVESVTLEPYGMRLETDEELNIRLEQEKKSTQSKAEHDRLTRLNTYKKLKQEFEPNS